MDNKKIMELLTEATARVDHVIHLGSLDLEFGSVPKSMELLIKEASPEELSDIFIINEDEASDVRINLGADVLADSLLDYVDIYNRFGFVIQIATPVMEKSGHEKRYSWGAYSTKWVYGETYEEAIQTGLEFVRECRQKEEAAQ